METPSINPGNNEVELTPQQSAIEKNRTLYEVKKDKDIIEDLYRSGEYEELTQEERDQIIESRADEAIRNDAIEENNETPEQKSERINREEENKRATLEKIELEKQREIAETKAAIDATITKLDAAYARAEIEAKRHQEYQDSLYRKHLK